MKKIIAIAALTAALASSSAFAKTEGNYVGIDFLKTSVTNRYQSSGGKAAGYEKFDNTSNGVGVNYKHAINFNDVFVAPGVFFDRLGSEATDVDGGTLSTQSRYGAKLDVGYDVNENFSAYVTNGLAHVKYNINLPSNSTSTGAEISYFYGAGLSTKITKDLSLNVEYNTQTLSIATPKITGADHIKSKLNVAKLGLSYNF